MGERGGQQVGAREHRLALGEMRHRPGDSVGRGRCRCGIPRGVALRRVRSGPRSRRFRRPYVHGRSARLSRISGLGERRSRRLPSLARLRCRFASRFQPRRRRPFHCTGDQRAGIEAEIGRLLCPHTAQFVAVDVALGGARHQRRALGRRGLSRRGAEIPLRHRRLDLGAPGREGLDRRARDAGDLEASVGMGLLDAVAEPRQAAGKLVAVEHADQLLPRVEPLIGHRAPLAVLALHHVCQHGMAMQLRIEIARRVVAEGGGDDLLVADAPHLPGFRILHAGLGGVLLDPGERCRHGAVVRLDDALVAADQRSDGDRLGRGEGEVAAGTMVDLPVLAAPPEPRVRAVRHLAFEHRPEGVGVDRALQPELLRAPAGPGAGVAMLGIVLRVITVALVVGRALGRRGKRADRQHVRATRSRGRRRRRRSAAGLPVPNRLPQRRHAARALRHRHPAPCPCSPAPLCPPFRPGRRPIAIAGLSRQGHKIQLALPGRGFGRHVRRIGTLGAAGLVRLVRLRDRNPVGAGFGGIVPRADAAPSASSSGPAPSSLRGTNRSAAAGRATYFRRIEATGKGPGNLR